MNQNSEQAARNAAAAYVAKYPRVMTDVTVRLTPSGWIAYDWSSRYRIYPERRS